MEAESITYYELCYLSNLERVKRFISIDLEEIKLKTSEVLSSGDQVRIEFNKVVGTKAQMLSAIKKAAGCI